MENSKFVLGSKYDLRTKLILLIGANILIFLGFDWIYQSLITLFFLVIIISDGYKKSAIRYILFFVISVVLEKSLALSLIHISEPTRPVCSSRMPSSA